MQETMIKSGWWYRTHLTHEDNVCDYLMRPWGELDRMLSSIEAVTLPENKEVYYLVEYDDLVSKPDEVMKGLYNFIGLDEYKHDYNKIIKAETESEALIGAPEDLHKVRLKLKKTSTPVEKVLSKYVIDKYSNLEFWRAKQTQ
jgi:sulfotransferase